MLLYPLLAEGVYRMGRLVASKNSWLGAVIADQQWKKASPLEGEVIWMHCASLGEFEMGKPVLEAFLKDVPDMQAVVTFFSPSGYVHRSKYSGAKVHYLPIDAPSEVSKWLAYSRPCVALFIRYDLWPNHIAGLRKRSIPVVVAGMSAPKSPWFLQRTLPLFRRNFTQGVSVWGMVEQADAATMSRLGVHSQVLGNPKFDYANTLVQTSAPEVYAQWKGQQRKPILLVASAHHADIRFLKNHLDWTSYSIWLVPHKVEDGLAMIAETQLERTARDTDVPRDIDVLLVETFGVLRSLYALADEIFIGGGFEKAVHNVLEATAAGKSVASGPNTKKMPENETLIREGLLFPCETKNELDQYLGREKLGEKEKALNVLRAHSGSVSRIVEVLKQTV